MTVDRYECQPDDWSYTHDDYDFDPDLHGEQWASQARSGRERCAGCGDEWSVGDDHQCKCEKGDEQ